MIKAFVEFSLISQIFEYLFCNFQICIIRLLTFEYFNFVCGATKPYAGNKLFLGHAIKNFPIRCTLVEILWIYGIINFKCRILFLIIPFIFFLSKISQNLNFSFHIYFSFLKLFQKLFNFGCKLWFGSNFAFWFCCCLLKNYFYMNFFHFGGVNSVFSL